VSPLPTFFFQLVSSHLNCNTPSEVLAAMVKSEQVLSSVYNYMSDSYSEIISKSTIIHHIILLCDKVVLHIKVCPFISNLPVCGNLCHYVSNAIPMCHDLFVTIRTLSLCQTLSLYVKLCHYMLNFVTMCQSEANKFPFGICWL